MNQLTNTIEVEEVAEIHWACGKVNCDCDQQYEDQKDYEDGQ